MSPDDFTEYLYKAMEKGRELEKARSLAEDFLTKEEVMKMLHLSSVNTLKDKIRNKEFKQYGERPKLYKKSEVLAYIERTKNH